MQYPIERKAIDRAHRIGGKKAGKNRPIVVKFTFFKDRDAILRNKKMLAGSQMHITEDFSQEIREVRKRLWELTYQDRERKDKVFLVFDKIKINGCLYRLSADWSDLIQLTPTA